MAHAVAALSLFVIADASRAGGWLDDVRAAELLIDELETSRVEDRVLCNHGQGGSSGASSTVPWSRVRLPGEGEFGAQDLFVFAAVFDPAARTVLMVAFVKDERPRFLWDHMQTSYDSAAVLAGARCEWHHSASSGAATTTSSTLARATVEVSVDGAEALLRPWDGGDVATWFDARPTWRAAEVPRFSNVARVVCAVPDSVAEDAAAGVWSMTLRRDAPPSPRASPAEPSSGRGVATRSTNDDVGFDFDFDAEFPRNGDAGDGSPRRARSARAEVAYALPLQLCPRTVPRRANVAVCTQPFRKRCTGKCPGSDTERAASWARYVEKLREWALYGEEVGIERVYVYDRDAELDAEPTLAALFDRGLLVHVHWPAFSNEWTKLPLETSVIPKGDWNLFDKALADKARVDFSLNPDRTSAAFNEHANGVVFNKDPIVFDQVIAINHCFYTNRYAASWLASTDPDEYWYVRCKPRRRMRLLWLPVHSVRILLTNV